MQFTTIFLTRHGELRAGWRLLLFVLITSFIGFLITAPFVIFKIATSFLVTLLALFTSLLGSFVMTRYINKKPFAAIGFSIHPGTFREVGVGLLLGFLMMTGIFLVEFGTGHAVIEWRGLGIWDILWMIVSAAFLFLIAAVLEEVLFRGYLFQTMMQAITFLPATVLMAVLFAAAHMNNPNASTYGIINVGLAAGWLSFAYLKTRSLWLPCGLHFSWNFTQTSIYGFPTSGAAFADKTIVHLTQSGPEWITGGAFGPEGGVLATLALILCTWYILKSKLLEAPEGIITLDSVEDLVLPRQQKSGETTT